MYFVVCGKEFLIAKMFDTQTYKLKTSSEPVSISNAADVFFTYSEKSDKKLC